MRYSDTPEFWQPFAHFLGNTAMQVAHLAREVAGPFGSDLLDDLSGGGDLQTVGDQGAGALLRKLLAQSGHSLALLDERTGELQSLCDNPLIGIIADELDGTRPHRMGMLCSSVSLAAYPLDKQALLKNVRCGTIVRLDTMADYTLVRGMGVLRGGKPLVVGPDTTKFQDARVYIVDFGSYPVMHSLYLKELAPHQRHGVSRVDSICYGGLLIIDGGVQLMMQMGVRERDVWRGLIGDTLHDIYGEHISAYPLDVAALAPMMWECGLVVTDAWGRPLRDTRIDKCGPEHLVSTVAASNQDLHADFMRRLEAREQYLLERRDEVARLLGL